MQVDQDIQWPKLIYDKAAVRSAGKVITACSSLRGCGEPLRVINNWRAAHAYPLSVIKTAIASLYGEVGDELLAQGRSLTPPLIAQRIKRIPAIKSKLQRSNIKLDKMQDIAGCRVILPNLREKSVMMKNLEEIHPLPHALVRVNEYSLSPRPSGYRGTHLIYAFQGEEGYEGLQVEVQLRTALQHSWATAVETAGTLLGNCDCLKIEDGPKKWLRFFYLIGDLFAHKEGTTYSGNIHGTRSEAIALEKELRVIERFKSLSLSNLSYRWDELDVDNGYHILSLDPIKKALSIRSYEHQDFRRALNSYFELDKNEEMNVSLVGTFSPYELNRLYPNYFLETESFIRNLESVLN